MSDVSQGAVNKLVKHLQALGYVSLTDADLALVKQAVATFRSSKAAARFMCGVLGGKGKCLTPLPTIDVRGDKASKAPASRIPSPDEIRLRGMAVPRSAAVSRVKTPRMPAVKFPRVVAAKETEVRESQPKAAAMKPRRKAKATASTKAGKVRMPKAARVLLSTLAILERNTLDIEAKATAAHSSLGDKRLSRSKKKAVQKRIEKLSQALDEVVLEVADTERQLAAVAAEHNTTVFELKALRQDKAWDKKAKELSAIGAAEDAKLKATLERARALLAQHDAEAAQAKSEPQKAECPPCPKPRPAKGTQGKAQPKPPNRPSLGGLEVFLEAIPNPDFSGSRSEQGKRLATIRVPGGWVGVNSLASARQLLRDFIDEHQIGVGNFSDATGRVRQHGKPFAEVSYNGDIWALAGDGTWERVDQRLDDQGQVYPTDAKKAAQKSATKPSEPSSKVEEAAKMPKASTRGAQRRTSTETQPAGSEQGNMSQPFTGKAPAAPSEPPQKPPREPKRGKAPSPPKNEPTDDGTALVNELAAQLLREG